MRKLENKDTSYETSDGLDQISIQREKDMLVKSLQYDGSVDVLMERAALEIDRLKEDRNILVAALGDLSFECFGIFSTHPPSIETYNKTFAVYQQFKDRI